MRKVILFGEDDAHEKVLSAVIKRFSDEYSIPVDLLVRSSIGGYGKAIAEFSELLKDIDRGRELRPDMIVIATDSNCKGLNERLKAIRKVVPAGLIDFVVAAVPSPHIERWLLLDSASFKSALGHGCAAPDHKCERSRYKNQLAAAVRKAGVKPLLGGVEYADDIVRNMDMDAVMGKDEGFNQCARGLKRKFSAWRRENG